MEDPKQAKGLVRREVTRIVTPGTLTDDALLDPRASNYLAAVVAGRAGRHGLGRSVDRPFQGRPVFRSAGWPMNWPALPRPNAAGRRQRLAAAAGSGNLRADRGGRPGPLRRSGGEALPKHFGTATLEGFGFDDARPTPRRSARPARCWSIWSKRKRRRWRTSTAW